MRKFFFVLLIFVLFPAIHSFAEGPVDLTEVRILAFDYVKNLKNPEPSFFKTLLPELENVQYIALGKGDELTAGLLIPEAYRTVALFNFRDCLPTENDIQVIEEFTLYGGTLLVIGNKLARKFAGTHFLQVILLSRYVKEIQGPLVFKASDIEVDFDSFTFSYTGRGIEQIFPLQPGDVMMQFRPDRWPIEQPFLFCGTFGYG
ncbi:hypothetical protein ACFL35_16680 [Candidatus Riflebacteria bacterium]